MSLWWLCAPMRSLKYRKVTNDDYRLFNKVACSYLTAFVKILGWRSKGFHSELFLHQLLILLIHILPHMTSSETSLFYVCHVLKKVPHKKKFQNPGFAFSDRQLSIFHWSCVCAQSTFSCGTSLNLVHRAVHVKTANFMCSVLGCAASIEYIHEMNLFTSVFYYRFSLLRCYKTGSQAFDIHIVKIKNKKIRDIWARPHDFAVPLQQNRSAKSAPLDSALIRLSDKRKKHYSTR